MNNPEIDWSIVRLGIVGSAVMTLTSGITNLILTNFDSSSSSTKHYGARFTDKTNVTTDKIDLVMKDVDPIDSLYFDISSAIHSIELNDLSRAVMWLDETHALGELHRSADSGIITKEEEEKFESAIKDIVGLINSGMKNEAYRRLYELQKEIGKINYISIASSFNNRGEDPQVHINGRFESIREKKKNEWIAKGYSPGLIEKAFKWADEWVRGIVNRFVRDPLLANQIAVQLYPEALDMSENWIKSIAGS